MDAMENTTNLIETLIVRVTDYGKTSLELAKLKAIDKTSDVISSIIPHSVVLLIIASFILFFNLGIAFWLGEILGKIYFGFFVVAAFYVVIGIFFRVFFYKWLKKIIGNYIIKHALK